MFKIDLKNVDRDLKKLGLAAEIATKRNLMKCGAYTRKIAMNSMRKGKPHGNSSRPGQPPHSILGKLKHLIRFAWDDARKSVVIGPEATGSGTKAPEILEHGGVARIRRVDKKGRVQFITVQIDPRPFMQPALMKTFPKIREYFGDSIKPSDVR